MSGYSKRGFTVCAVAARKACVTGGVVELTHSQGKVTKILMEITLLQPSHLRTKASLFQHDGQIFLPIKRRDFVKNKRTVMDITGTWKVNFKALPAFVKIFNTCYDLMDFPLRDTAHLFPSLHSIIGTNIRKVKMTCNTTRAVSELILGWPLHVRFQRRRFKYLPSLPPSGWWCLCSLTLMQNARAFGGYDVCG